MLKKIAEILKNIIWNTYSIQWCAISLGFLAIKVKKESKNRFPVTSKIISFISLIVFGKNYVYIDHWKFHVSGKSQKIVISMTLLRKMDKMASFYLKFIKKKHLLPYKKHCFKPDFGNFCDFIRIFKIKISYTSGKAIR